MDAKLNKESRAIIELMIADGIISREDAEKYFPELKSKDRRIRKEIINFLNAINKDTLEGRNFIADRYGDAIPDEMIPTWIDWLEKQGEQNLANSAKTCKDEQKPADKVEPKVIIPNFRVGDIIGLKNSYAEYKITEISDGYYRGKGWRLDIVAADESDDYELVKQNPAWSEKDEKNLQFAIDDFQFCVDNNQFPVVYNTEKHKEVLALLKSLKERYTWKPSDEQMSQLECVVTQNKDNILGKELMTLFNDLKKLKG